jgi:hypothetical protein
MAKTDVERDGRRTAAPPGPADVGVEFLSTGSGGCHGRPPLRDRAGAGGCHVAHTEDLTRLDGAPWLLRTPGEPRWCCPTSPPPAA